MRNSDESVNRILGLKGKVVHIEIHVQYSSDPGYLLVASLGKRDESLMKNIVKTIEPYGFNSLLVNFAIHKSFKSSHNPSKSHAEEMLDKICNDLVSQIDDGKKPGLFGFLKKGKKKVDEDEKTDKIEQADKTEKEERGSSNSEISDNRYISSEPPKVESKYKSEHILTGKGPFADKYPEFEEKKKTPSTFNTKNVYENEEIKRMQEAERKKREQEHQQKHVEKPTGEFNPYAILGLKKDVSCDEVKVKFKELIKKNNLSGIVNMTLQEKESKEAIVRDIIKAKDMIYKEKGCLK